MNTLRLSIFLLITIMLVPIDATAHCKGKHGEGHPHCDTGDPPDPPDPDPGSGNADPQLVYRDRDNLPASFLANADGSSQTQIWDAGIIGSLDAPRFRVLFRGDGLDMLKYENIDGQIVNVMQSPLLDETDVGGTFVPRGVTDWSQTGDKISYTYRSGSIRRIMVTDIDEFGQIPLFENHITVYETAPNGGLGFAAWDVSGDFIFLQLPKDSNGDSSDLVVLDVRAGVVGDRIVRRIDLDLVNGLGVNSPQWLSAGSKSGLYSFDPDNNFPDSDSSLCLMIANTNWGAHPNPVYSTWIIDLPFIFNNVPGQCTYANVGSPIIGFQGSDFTTDDAGIVGRDFSKPRPQGIYVHDPDENELKRIVKVGSRPDWSN